MQRHVNIFLGLGSILKDKLRKEYLKFVSSFRLHVYVTQFLSVPEKWKIVKKTAAEAFLLHEHDRN